jgi:hypothetical protein
MALLEDLRNLLQQLRIVTRTLAWGSGPPRIVATGTHPLNLTQRPHGVVFFVAFDEREGFAFRSEVNSMAFFKMSCST